VPFPFLDFHAVSRQLSATADAPIRFYQRPGTIESFTRLLFVQCISPAFSLLTLGHSLRCFSRALRTSMFCFGCAALWVWVSKKKIFLRLRSCGQDFPFGASTESTSRPWERDTSRRFAQECPEGNPGKYKQGETQWHSTKTKSL
jgi:hypothetical protein